MTIIPPLTREQCQLIVEHYESRAADAGAARQRYIWARDREPILSAESHQAWLVGMESAALFAEQQAAVAQLLALQALHQLDLTKGAKLL